MKNERFVDVKGAAEYLGLSRRTVYQITHKRKITHYKPNGRKVYFLIEDLDKYLQSCRIDRIVKLNNPERKERIIEKTEKWIEKFCNTGYNDNE